MFERFDTLLKSLSNKFWMINNINLQVSVFNRDIYELYISVIDQFTTFMQGRYGQSYDVWVVE